MFREDLRSKSLLLHLPWHLLSSIGGSTQASWCVDGQKSLRPPVLVAVPALHKHVFRQSKQLHMERKWHEARLCRPADQPEPHDSLLHWSFVRSFCDTRSQKEAWSLVKPDETWKHVARWLGDSPWHIKGALHPAISTSQACAADWLYRCQL